MIVAFLALVGALLQPGTPVLAVAPAQAEVSIAQEAAGPEQNEQVAQIFENITMTAYSSTPDQTDDSPFIMANGKRVHDGAVAANFLPFGTKVRIPALYGDKVFIVEDRMNRRFNNRMDIWMETRGEAIHFGVRKATIEVLESAI